jgi:hypothetical protein
VPELVNVDNFACADSERMMVAFREDTVRDVPVDAFWSEGWTYTVRLHRRRAP